MPIDGDEVPNQPTFDGLDERPPDLDQQDDWQNDDAADDDPMPPPEPASESHREMPVERNRRNRQAPELAPIPVTKGK